MGSNRKNVKSISIKASGTHGTRLCAIATEVVDSHERGKDYVTESEIERLRVGARRGRHGLRDDLIVLLMYRHGLRVSEAVGLRIDQLDLNEARIRMRRLKRGLDVHHPLEGDELRAVKAYLRTRADHLPWLFVSERSGQLTRQAVNYLLKTASARAKLPHVWPHMLRHGCGFHLANNGHDTRLIGDYLGHRDLKSTARYTRTSSRPFEGLWKR